MPPTADEQRAGPSAALESFSCAICRQRKVRCDRRNPCSNCTRAATQCSFIPPLRGKRKRRKAPKEGLHAKLRRYEDLLKSFGSSIEPSDNDNISDAETMSEPDVEMTEDAESRIKSRSCLFAFDENKPKLITKNGSSRYFDNGLWPDIGEEFHHHEEGDLPESVAESNSLDSDLFLDPPEENDLVLSTFSKTDNLASLHHPSHILQKMWEVYVDRVDPLIKVLHLPTFWSTMTSALRNPLDIPKSLEAAIFAFYLATISSLEDIECYCLLGEQKSVMSARCKIAARQALINAGFLKTSSLVTLQAYVIFLMGMRGHYQSDTIFILSGVAVRLGRRMGLHRDGTFLGLSPFETEMRRRLWYHIIHIDYRTSDFSGTKPSMDLFLSDTKIPLNIEDEDLSPGMVNPPTERNGITPMVLCLLKCDMMDLLRKVTRQSTYEFGWDSLTNPSLTLAEKVNVINQVEDHVEMKYLRYCDPLNPLHYLLSTIARSAICKMNLFAHNPRQFANCGVKVPQKVRDIIFANGTKLLEYGNLIHRDQSLRKFRWLLGTSYIWDTLLYVLIEARQRKIGPEVDRVWQLLDGMFANYPLIFAEATEALYAALGNWTLQVWDDCIAARKEEGLPESPTPEYISAIRRRRSLAKNLVKSDGTTSPQRNSADYGKAQPLGDDENLISDSYDFSNLLSFDLEPNEWVQWERLLAGQGI